VQKIEKALSCARMLMRRKISMHVETVCLLSRKAIDAALEDGKFDNDSFLWG